MQLDADAWGTSSAILSGGSALIAILSGIEQMPSSARAKKNIDWLQASLQNEQEGSRRKTLEKKLVQNQARLIARQEVPLWYLSPILVWPLLVTLSLYSASGKHSSLFSLLFAASTTIIFGLTLIRITIRAYCERTRIYYQFCSGKYNFHPAEVDILSLMQGGTHKELIQSGCIILGTSFCFATLILNVKYGPDPWRMIIFYFSVAAILLTCIFIKDHAYRLAGDSTGGVSGLQRRINIRQAVNSLLGPELEKKIDEVDKSLQIIDELRKEVTAAMTGPLRKELGDKIQDLKKNADLIISDLKSLRNTLLSPKDGRTFANLSEQVEEIDKKIEQNKIEVQSIKFG
ncbi:hypothetical protein [Corynebacterium ulcerans]|uniref:hypothetical protein n=1 Tax=Corynebacterium ulcerans TaxID=65058 RepID=UPI0011AED47E|nr:hypothetical protein [Corynebacterium ulcerans]